jgi:predicted membrane protein (TIGR00267 family)
MGMGLSVKLRQLNEYRRLAAIDEIGRRYLAMNAFDGILTMIGVVMGSYVAGVLEPRVVLATGLATSLAMGVSGLWGAYMTESAERRHELHALEQAMLTDLHDTEQARASRFAVVVVSVIDGLAPLVAGAAVLLPFLFATWVGEEGCYAASLGVALAMLFGLGAFLARVARTSLLRSGLRMIVAGLVCVALSLLLNVEG